MKSLKYYLMALAGIAMLNACSDDDPVPGNPTMDFQAEPSSALFGDSLPFTIKASDADVPLSTLKARLYFSDEMVSETIIRTKEYLYICRFICAKLVFGELFIGLFVSSRYARILFWSVSCGDGCMPGVRSASCRTVLPLLQSGASR